MFSISHTNVFLSTLFSNTFSLCSSLNVRHHQQKQVYNYNYIISATTPTSALLTRPGSALPWAQPADVSEHLRTGTRSTSPDSRPPIPLSGWRPSTEIPQTELRCHWRRLCGSPRRLRYDGRTQPSDVVLVWSVQSPYWASDSTRPGSSHRARPWSCKRTGTNAMVASFELTTTV